MGVGGHSLTQVHGCCQTGQSYLNAKLFLLNSSLGSIWPEEHNISVAARMAQSLGVAWSSAGLGSLLEASCLACIDCAKCNSLKLNSPRPTLKNEAGCKCHDFFGAVQEEQTRTTACKPLCLFLGDASATVKVLSLVLILQHSDDQIFSILELVVGDSREPQSQHPDDSTIKSVVCFIKPSPRLGLLIFCGHSVRARLALSAGVRLPFRGLFTASSTKSQYVHSYISTYNYK